MENGELRTFKAEHKPDWHAGDRVKLVDARLVANDEKILHHQRYAQII